MKGEIVKPDDLSETAKEIDSNKAQIEKNFAELKNDLKGFVSQVKAHRNEVLNEVSTSLMENAALTVTEFFFVGFYVGKMMKILKAESK
jgi:hypothetical protein